MALALNFAEINELAKFSFWCTQEVSTEVFLYQNDDDAVGCLNRDVLARMGNCLMIWRDGLQRGTSGTSVYPMPHECGDVFVCNTRDRQDR